MKNAYKKFKNKKFKKIIQRDSSLGHIIFVQMSKIYVTFELLLVCDFKN
jgi:hypothetical protein